MSAKYLGTCKMPPAELDSLSSILGSHVVEGATWLSKAVPWPLNARCDRCTQTGKINEQILQKPFSNNPPAPKLNEMFIVQLSQRV